MADTPVPGPGDVVATGFLIAATGYFLAAAVGGDGAVPRAADRTFRRTRAVQIHHVATDKHSYWSPIFEPLFEKAGISLQDAANLVPVAGHRGRHPEAYHRAVLGAILTATQGKEGNEYKEALLKTLNQLRVQAATPGSPLNSLITK